MSISRSFHVYPQGIISFHMVTQLLESTDVGFHPGVCLLSTFFYLNTVVYVAGRGRRNTTNKHKNTM